MATSSHPPAPTTESSNPVATFTADRRGRVFAPQSQAEFDAALPFDGVAGIGASPTDATPGTLLIDDGVNLGATARVAPLVLHPRTALGVDATGTRLTLVVIDGRQPDWSVGINLPDLAQLLIDHGVHDAINLDGGGSSTFYFNPALLPGQPADAPVITNRFSDKAERAVSTHLGFRYHPDTSVTSPSSGDPTP
ncbi:MAG: phosphodiester glycosidase family protein [Nitrospiraceae bacterium]|nr:phosphodiester glycosidase family protein [Nitrospiraceae bacterium]